MSSLQILPVHNIMTPCGLELRVGFHTGINHRNPSCVVRCCRAKAPKHGDHTAENSTKQTFVVSKKNKASTMYASGMESTARPVLIADTICNGYHMSLEQPCIGYLPSGKYSRYLLRRTSHEYPNDRPNTAVLSYRHCSNCSHSML